MGIQGIRVCNTERLLYISGIVSQGGVSSDEYQVVRDSLQSLRTRFPGNHPQNQTIDQLETSISTLMDRLQAQENEEDARVRHDQVVSDKAHRTLRKYERTVYRRC